MNVRAVWVAAIVGAVAPAAGATPAPNQVNTFQAGNVAAWTNGDRITDPAIVAAGGPAGASDAFLRVTANGGGGPGSKLITFNQSAAWSGNFTTAGVNAISMDLKNFNTFPLSMRIGLEETGGTWYVLNPAFTLPADNAWHTATFNLAAANFSTVTGGTPLATGLTRVREFRILHNPSVDYRGAAVSASFGVDNIRAVPEPAATLLLAPLVPMLSRRRRSHSPAGD